MAEMVASFKVVLMLSGHQGKAKYNAWKKESDAGTTAEAAQKKYVELIESLKQKYGFEG